jgi:DNA replication protein DnaC
VNTSTSIESLGSILAGFKTPPTTGTCEECGEGVYHQDKRCPACSERAERRRACRARAIQAAQVSIPASFAFARLGFDDPKVRACISDAAALERAKAAASGSDSMLLRGEAGLGKTVSAAAVAWASAERGIAPMWVDSFELASAVARSPLGVEPRLVREALAAQLLVVDDLGAETAVATSPIAEVLHRRHARGARTLVTTWCDVAAIRTRYGDGVARRLHERTVVVEFRVQTPGGR